MCLVSSRKQQGKSNWLSAPLLVVRKADILYFADGIRFSDVDLKGLGLPDQFRKRIDEFYVRPARECASRGYAFAAGLLLVSCIDALARIRLGTVSEHGFEQASRKTRFVEFVRNSLTSFSEEGLAKKFFWQFRHGLVHQAELQDGAQFSFDTEQTIDSSEGLVIVNPKFLAMEVSDALEQYVQLLRSDRNEREKLAKALEKDLSKDFRFANST